MKFMDVFPYIALHPKYCLQLWGFLQPPYFYHTNKKQLTLNRCLWENTFKNNLSEEIDLSLITNYRGKHCHYLNLTYTCHCLSLLLLQYYILKKPEAQKKQVIFPNLCDYLVMKKVCKLTQSSWRLCF